MSTNTHVAFVAHPVRGDVKENLERLQRWLRWLVYTYEEVSFNVSWVVYCQTLDDAEPEERARGMRDAKALLLRCDSVYVVGGAITPGMQAEIALATAQGLSVVDLTSLGPEPPELPQSS